MTLMREDTRRYDELHTEGWFAMAGLVDRADMACAACIAGEAAAISVEEICWTGN